MTHWDAELELRRQHPDSFKICRKTHDDVIETPAWPERNGVLPLALLSFQHGLVYQEVVGAAKLGYRAADDPLRGVWVVFDLLDNSLQVEVLQPDKPPLSVGGEECHSITRHAEMS